MSDDALRKVAADATELLRLYDLPFEMELGTRSHRARAWKAAWEQLRTDLQLLAAQSIEQEHGFIVSDTEAASLLSRETPLIVRRFPVGCRVQLTTTAIEQGTKGPRMGTVTAYSRDSHSLIRVQRDGQHDATLWHADFWEPIAQEKE